jgi:hypothetical protein
MTRNVRPEIHASLGHADTEFERSHTALAHRRFVVLIGDCLIDGKVLRCSRRRNSRLANICVAASAPSGINAGRRGVARTL